MDVADISREVIAGEYLPPSKASPATNVTVTVKTRQAGNYTCNVSVFRASGDNITDVTTAPLVISGTIAMGQSVILSESS